MIFDLEVPHGDIAIFDPGAVGALDDPHCDPAGADEPQAFFDTLSTGRVRVFVDESPPVDVLRGFLMHSESALLNVPTGQLFYGTDFSVSEAYEDHAIEAPSSGGTIALSAGVYLVEAHLIDWGDQATDEKLRSRLEGTLTPPQLEQFDRANKRADRWGCSLGFIAIIFGIATPSLWIYLGLSGGLPILLAWAILIALNSLREAKHATISPRSRKKPTASTGNSPISSSPCPSGTRESGHRPNKVDAYWPGPRRPRFFATRRPRVERFPGHENWSEPLVSPVPIYVRGTLAKK